MNENILNLYIDESGRATLKDVSHDFFVMTGIILSPKDKELADKLFEIWRGKYLKNPHKAFHAVEFFGMSSKYISSICNMGPMFNNAVILLKSIIDLLSIKQDYVCVVFVNKKTVIEIAQQKFGDDWKNSRLPIDFINDITFKYLLKFHREKSTPSKILGQVVYESNEALDEKILETFNKTKNPSSYNSPGISFFTKDSIDSGLAVADIISYISLQNLEKHWLKIKGLDCENSDDKETKKVCAKSKGISTLRNMMTDRIKIQKSEIDLTEECVKYVKKV